MRFVSEWLRWSLSGDLITDTLDRHRQHASFVQHRHDQSLLSILAKQHGIKSFPMPTKVHDVRDVWAWEAGYCEANFRWPLPSYRVPGVYGYFTHYKEMGHQHAAMRQCLNKQGGSAPVPLADYVDSRQVMRGIRADDVIATQARRRRWTKADLKAWPSQCDVSLIHQPSKEHRRTAPCTGNGSFGAVRYKRGGICHTWTSDSCLGSFRCEGTVLQCGSEGNHGRLTFCGCSEYSDGSLQSMSHWFDTSDVTRFPVFGGKVPRLH